MQTFDVQPRPRLVFGPGAIERLGSLARDLGTTTALLVTDPGLVTAGHAPRIRTLLEQAGLTVHVFDRVEVNPTTRCVHDCLEVARRIARLDLFVGLGGGSALDTAKGCNFLLTNGGRMQDYWGVGKATKPMLPLLAIPTTAGTGSECQSAALIADEHTHQKMACLDPKATARIAILDPELTLSLPRQVTAHTGVDALVHALETAVTTRRNPWSLTFSHRAFSLLTALPRVLQQPDDLEARSRMLLGAAYAGMAIESSMLGAAHAAANPLTAHHQVTHGVAVGLMIPHVIRFNAADPAVAQAYALLAHQAGLVPDPNDTLRALDCLLATVQHLLNCAGVLGPLTAHGIAAADLPPLADEAARQWTAQFNPRCLGAEDFLSLYQAALQPPAIPT